jgi:hypothetical protein
MQYNFFPAQRKARFVALTGGGGGGNNGIGLFYRPVRFVGWRVGTPILFAMVDFIPGTLNLASVRVPKINL